MRLKIGRMWRSAAALAFVVCWAASASAQSTLVEYPTPVFSNEIAGRIAPRDLGDARLTRHFYTFNGTEGDLVLTVEGSGLDGSVDLFTSPGLRPLTGVTLYGGTQTRVTRSVYLQGTQPLVLRVEGRAAGEAEGSYRVRLDGAFAPASAELASANSPALPTLSESTARRGTRRVNAAGVLLPEPTPEPTPAVEAAERRTDEETPAERASEETSAEAREPAATRTPARPAPARSRTPRRRGATARRTQPPATADAPPADAATAESAEAPSATRRATRRPGRRTSARSRPDETARDPNAAPTAPPPVVTATRLVIETKDGNRIERDMSGLRRVSVDNNQVVITARDGRVERVPLANVSRMSIEP